MWPQEMLQQEMLQQGCPLLGFSPPGFSPSAGSFRSSQGKKSRLESHVSLCSRLESHVSLCSVKWLNDYCRLGRSVFSAE
jgi:hypothetical protein